MGLLAGDPLGSAPQEVFLGDHFQDGADVLGHATVHEDERVLELLTGIGRDGAVIEDLVGGHESAAGDAKFRVAFRGEGALDEFHAGPDAAGVLPAAAGAADPLA